MRNDIERIMLTEEQIQNRVKELGAQIAADYADRNPVMICILKGSTMFFADLLRAMPIRLTMDFMAVSSYGRSTKSSGEVEIRKDLSGSIEHRHAVIVEDIIDSGFTLSYLTRMLYSGFEIEDAFVVGYGLDYDEAYRNLPYIGVLKPSVYENN